MHTWPFRLDGLCRSMQPMFEFNDLLRKLDLDPQGIRLLRHDPRTLSIWRRGKEVAFGCFASFQSAANSPCKGTDLVCHFMPGPLSPDGEATALFLGATRILDRWIWDGDRLPKIQDKIEIDKVQGRDGVEAFDLEWIPEAHEYSERLLIGWGVGTRAWSQWSHRNPKEILEIRLQAYEPAFPGFASFHARTSEVSTFPQSWIGALSGVKGIYLLVAENGDQYVGSASGEGGFIGRWQAYQANGHGGNVLLRKSGHKDYSVSILEIASPDMSAADIIARESFWKIKLGARAHGLNAN